MTEVTLGVTCMSTAPSLVRFFIVFEENLWSVLASFNWLGELKQNIWFNTLQSFSKLNELLSVSKLKAN
jgi:hypothetical protein